MDTQGVVDHENGLTLTTDRPITKKVEDRLGRGPFVTRLSRAISSWKGDEGLVIALYGAWGCGKSSVKNLLVEELKATASDSVEIIEFNPWQWRGHDDVSAAFFREISLKLVSIHRAQDPGKAAKKFRRYAKFLGIGTALLDGPKTVGALLVGIIGLLGLTLPTFLPSDATAAVAHALGVAGILIAAVLAWGEKVLEKIADWLDSQSEPGPNSLEEQKRSVASALRQYPKTLLVVIDDVDRLATNEILSVFQLVKANADFPRFVYVVLFQRDIVEKALQTEVSGDGSKYLEKIVQVGFDLPVAPSAEIEKILFDGLNALLANDLAKFDNQYWGNVYQGGLQQYFTNLREVKRFLGVFGFQIGLLRTEGFLEVNPVDLIALETLNLFEPAVYAALSSQRALLTGRSHSTSGDRAAAKEDCLGILNLAPEQRREGVGELLKYLFPTVADAFGGMRVDAYGEWLANLRVCSPEIFNRYFERSLAQRDVSQAEVSRLMSHAPDGKALTVELKRYASDGRLMTALERLRPALASELAPDDVADALIALFNIGDDLPEMAPGFFSMPPHWMLLGLIRTVLKREPDEDKRDAALERAIRESACVGMVVMYMGSESNAEARSKNPDSMAIRETSVSRFCQLCVEQINKAASNGALHTQRYLAHLLFRWRDWSGNDEVRAWVSKLTANQQGVIAFLRAFLHVGTSQTAGDNVVSTHRYIKLSDTENFVESVNIEKVLLGVSLTSLEQSDRQAVEAFTQALKRKREGKQEGIFGWEEGN